MSLVALNEKGNSGIETYDFNCGGFALGTFDWYEPISYQDLSWSGDPINEILETLAGEILHDFPFLQRVKHPDLVPKHIKVIGFRFEVSEDYDNYDEEEEMYGEYIRDFHFAVRYDGVWYDKPGPHEIRELPVKDIFDPWVFADFWYDSEIAWFIDPTNELLHDYRD